MSAFQEEVEFQCPYCMAGVSITVDTTGGRRQAFSTDCEVCCRPIAVRLEIEGGAVAGFSAERES